MLADRLFSNSVFLMDYDTIATTVFTPIEYGAIGFVQFHCLSLSPFHALIVKVFRRRCREAVPRRLRGASNAYVQRHSSAQNARQVVFPCSHG